MDKETLSVYGLILTALLCMGVILAFATPFGEYTMEQTNVIIEDLLENVFSGGNEETFAIDTPELSLNESILTIHAVSDANSYEIYLGHTLLVATTETTIDLNGYITSPGIHVIHVVALSDSGCSDTATIGYVLE